MNIPGNEILKAPVVKYFQKHLLFAESLISMYKSGEPFHLYIKKYYSSNKKHGSKDRKQIASLCYNYFRLGEGVSSHVTLQDKFLLGAFLCGSTPSILLSQLKPGWNEKIKCPLNEKLKIVENYFDPKIIFPLQQFLSDEIDHAKFATSFLEQPKLFLRIRPGKEATVPGKIRSANFTFEKIGDDCLVFSHNEKITDAIVTDREAVIQDYNSQRTGEFFSKYLFTQQVEESLEKISLPITVWDCCAGSGGKSILAVDSLKNIKLTVTDRRPAILQNLKKRFAAAGIKNYAVFVSDLSTSVPPPLKGVKRRQDLIIADVPCSGSGTWSRTPEQLNFFKENEIEKYALLQKNIIRNIIPHLQDRGILLYITCSVFKKENEENIDYFLQNFQLNLLHKEYLNGYEMQADTLFVAVFAKS
ncbi:MAG TPA: Fmu (Sun) domain-containing protein [Chitinophagaceae bacterium]|nr:Fmu (Sun) domain-containing protein [Chitinophagaceae bacterium]